MVLSLGGTPLYGLYGDVPPEAAGQGMLFDLSVPNRVYDLARIYAKQGIQDI